MDPQVLKDKISAVVGFLKAQAGVDYANVKVNHIEIETVSTENQKVAGLTFDTDMGYGVRVYYKGALGFAASQDFSAMEDTAKEALRIAKASFIALREPAKLAPKPVVIDHYQTPIEIDAFSITTEEKLELLLKCEQLMRGAAPEVFRTAGHLAFRREWKTFADTEGSYITQLLYSSGGGITAVAAGHGETQTRTYPNAHRGNHSTAGWEYVQKLDFPGNAPRVGREAMLLLDAQDAPSGYFDIITAPSALTLQLHESVGHPIELDRVLGQEFGLAGTSFLDSVEPGKFRYGSEHVNLVADNTSPGCIGTYGYDDDGVASHRIEVVKNGIFMDFASSRETAAAMGKSSSNGNNTADGWGRTPIVRMGNVSLLPGNFTLEELIAGVEYGFYLDINNLWSIDDRRHNFQMGYEVAYEIKDGKLSGKLFRNLFYSGITPEFWGSCDGVANESYWTSMSIVDCAKGEPGQSSFCAHGSSPARFRKVKVGVPDA